MAATLLSSNSTRRAVIIPNEVSEILQTQALQEAYVWAPLQSLVGTVKQRLSRKSSLVALSYLGLDWLTKAIAQMVLPLQYVSHRPPVPIFPEQLLAAYRIFFDGLIHGHIDLALAHHYADWPLRLGALIVSGLFLWILMGIPKDEEDGIAAQLSGFAVQVLPIREKYKEMIGGFVMGGVLGNGLELAFRGYVIDWFRIRSGQHAIIPNLADLPLLFIAIPSFYIGIAIVLPLMAVKLSRDLTRDAANPRPLDLTSADESPPKPHEPPAPPAEQKPPIGPNRGPIAHMFDPRSPELLGLRMMTGRSFLERIETRLGLRVDKVGANEIESGGLPTDGAPRRSQKIDPLRTRALNISIRMEPQTAASSYVKDAFEALRKVALRGLWGELNTALISLKIANEDATGTFGTDVRQWLSDISELLKDYESRKQAESWAEAAAKRAPQIPVPSQMAMPAPIPRATVDKAPSPGDRSPQPPTREQEPPKPSLRQQVDALSFQTRTLHDDLERWGQRGGTLHPRLEGPLEHLYKARGLLHARPAEADLRWLAMLGWALDHLIWADSKLNGGQTGVMWPEGAGELANIIAGVRRVREELAAKLGEKIEERPARTMVPQRKPPPADPGPELDPLTGLEGAVKRLEWILRGLSEDTQGLECKHAISQLLVALNEMQGQSAGKKQAFDQAMAQLNDVWSTGRPIFSASQRIRLRQASEMIRSSRAKPRPVVEPVSAPRRWLTHVWEGNPTLAEALWGLGRFVFTGGTAAGGLLPGLKIQVSLRRDTQEPSDLQVRVVAGSSIVVLVADEAAYVAATTRPASTAIKPIRAAAPPAAAAPDPLATSGYKPTEALGRLSRLLNGSISQLYEREPSERPTWNMLQNALGILDLLDENTPLNRLVEQLKLIQEYLLDARGKATNLAKPAVRKNIDTAIELLASELEVLKTRQVATLVEAIRRGELFQRATQEGVWIYGVMFNVSLREALEDIRQQGDDAKLQGYLVIAVKLAGQIPGLTLYRNGAAMPLTGMEHRLLPGDSLEIHTTVAAPPKPEYVKRIEEIAQRGPNPQAAAQWLVEVYDFNLSMAEAIGHMMAGRYAWSDETAKDAVAEVMALHCEISDLSKPEQIALAPILAQAAHYRMYWRRDPTMIPTLVSVLANGAKALDREADKGKRILDGEKIATALIHTGLKGAQADEIANSMKAAFNPVLVIARYKSWVVKGARRTVQAAYRVLDPDERGEFEDAISALDGFLLDPAHVSASLYLTNAIKAIDDAILETGQSLSWNHINDLRQAQDKLKGLVEPPAAAAAQAFDRLPAEVQELIQALTVQLPANAIKRASDILAQVYCFEVDFIAAGASLHLLGWPSTQAREAICAVIAHRVPPDSILADGDPERLAPVIYGAVRFMAAAQKRSPPEETIQRIIGILRAGAARDASGLGLQTDRKGSLSEAFVQRLHEAGLAQIEAEMVRDHLLREFPSALASAEPVVKMLHQATTGVVYEVVPPPGWTFLDSFRAVRRIPETPARLFKWVSAVSVQQDQKLPAGAPYKVFFHGSSGIWEVDDLSVPIGENGNLMFSETDEATVARIAEDLLRLVNEPDVGVLMARDIANVGNNLQYVWPTHPQDRPYHARQLEEILDTNNPLKRQLPVAVRSALEGHLKTLLQLLPSAAPAAAAQEPIFSIDEAIEAAARLLGQFEEEAGIESPELRQGSLDFFHYQQSIEQGSANPDFLRSAEEAFQAAAQDVHTVYPQDHRLRFILEYISRDLIGYAFALINNVAVDVRTRHKTGTVDDALGSIGRAMGAVGGAGETSERARIVPLLHQGLAHICDALGAGQASDGMPTFNTDEEQRLRQAAEIVEDRLSRLVSPDAGPVEKQMNSPFAVRFLKRAS